MSTQELLQAIYEERGRLTPADVLDVASDPEHPLHSRFEWADDVAAHGFRLMQAAGLIRRVKVRVRVDPVRTVTVRAFLHVPSSPDDEGDDDRSLYVPQSVVAERSDLQAVVLAQMERDWRDLRRKWQDQESFLRIVRRDLGDEAGAA